jgi:hypothetical protein
VRTIPASIIWCCPAFLRREGGWEILAEAGLTLQEEIGFVEDVSVVADVIAAYFVAVRA